MGKEFEWFSNPEGRLTTSTGVPYNELFSTEEIRRLTFTRLCASKDQELSPPTTQRPSSGQGYPAADSLMSRWLLLGAELFWYPPLAIATLLTSYSPLSLWGSWFAGYSRTTEQPSSQSVAERGIDEPSV